ncbi:hypothetical protein DD238_002892 [Peronospora effusa]|uniref:RanBP2-type domain-containing protein n=1 Tax=Peronospora effusa TaxID=542832 RepID=A0A3M6VUJ5_9STRA|nr:hypothetical protein DD238_002892 [Peronospora effusa]RQM09849.1 hypothetical protein DD237_002081 [Peronospora effusa]
MECFERGLELTSVNCGFCRRRVVGFARTKQYKVDEVMWQAIQLTCPFLGDIEDDRERLVEFFDEDAPPLHNCQEDNQVATSGDLKAFYNDQLQKHHAQVQEAEQRALQQTIDFLQNDPKFTASFAASSSSPASSTLSLISSETNEGAKKKRKISLTHRPITRSLNAGDANQQKLDEFFESSRGIASQSGTSDENLRRTFSTSVEFSSPRARTHLKMNELKKKYFLRSTSHSPTLTKERRRHSIKGCKPLRQLTLNTTISPIALHTRSRELKRANSIDSGSDSSKMLTRQQRRQISWKCAQCTYRNTCFDNRCSMCRSLSPPEADAFLRSQ